MLRLGIYIIVLLANLSCEGKKPIKKVEPPAPPKIKVVEAIPEPRIKFYLTFDDGPYYTTPNLVSKLNALNVKSNFFIVGSQVKRSSSYDSIFNSVKNSTLFKVFNHSYSHAVTHGRIHKYYESPEKVFEDIQRNKDIIKTEGNISRLPGKNTWRVGSRRIRSDEKTKNFIAFLDSSKNNENIIGWDIEWSLKQSTNRSNVDSLFNVICAMVNKNKSEKKDIVMLSHDYLYRTPESLENLSYLINRLKNELDCSFNWVEEMDGLFPKELAKTNK